jgi:peptide/nickel transport system substrate-binding protein
MLGRRTLMATAAALAAPRIGRAANSHVLRYVPRYGLVQLDPVATTDSMTRLAGLMVFESLYSVDEMLKPRPQMIAGHRVEDGGKHWTMRLREGLRFHDAQAAIPTPRFRAGQGAAEYSADHAGTTGDDEPARPVPEVVGSGPFRFLADQFSAGSSAAFAPFDAYIPRDEQPTGTAGGRRVRVARVEWVAIPDPGTAAAALQTGEVDWVETPLADLVPQLRQSRISPST